MNEDRELRKQIAAEAQTESATAASPLVRAFQFFLAPLLIVGTCVLVYAFLSYLVASPRSADHWLEEIKEGGPNTRQHATLQLVQALRRRTKPDPKLTAKIIDLYKSSRPEEHDFRKYLANCLATLRDPQARELMLEGAKGEKNLETRAACLDALGAIKDPSTLPDLVKLLDDPDGVVRKYAAFNAGAVAEKAPEAAGVVQALRARLGDACPDVGWNAAFALAYFLDDRSGTDTLKKMLDRKYLAGIIDPKDPNAAFLSSRAMVIACQAAAKIKDESFLPLLKDLTDTKKERDADVRFMAHQAIHAIGSK